MQQLRTYLLISIGIAFGMSACIKDDFVDDKIEPTLRLTSALESLAVGDTHDFDALYFDEVGMEQDVELAWETSDPAVATVDENGLVTAIAEGNVSISASYQELEAQDSFAVSSITMMEEMSRMGSLQTTSSYLLQGDFTLEETGNGLTLSFASNYQASTSLPGLYVYLTNNPSTIMGAYEIGAVETFSGAHSYALPASIGINDYSHVLYFCAPFNVKVGDGAIN